MGSKRRFLLLFVTASVALAVYVVFVPTYAGLAFYQGLSSEYADCGSEITRATPRQRNPDMRLCFETAFLECRPAKMHKTAYTVEGDPIMTTVLVEGMTAVLVEGERLHSCPVTVHYNSRDNFGEKRSFQTTCRKVVYRQGESEFLAFSQCDDGQDRKLFYVRN